MKFKNQVLILILLLAQLIMPMSYADNYDVVTTQASTQLKSWNVPLSGKCKGRVDQPHISKHVKGTVNLVLSADCPNQFLSITGVFFRKPIKVPADMKFGHASGRDKIKMNLAIPCLSNEGLSVHEYFVTATFLATGHFPVSKTYSWPVPC